MLGVNELFCHPYYFRYLQNKTSQMAGIHVRPFLNLAIDITLGIN